MRDPCLFCRDGGCPGSCRRLAKNANCGPPVKAESATQGAPPAAPPKPKTRLVSSRGGSMSPTAQRLFQQQEQRQSRGQANPQRTLGKAEVRAHALSFVGQQARHLPEVELAAGAAHHLSRLRKSLERGDEVAAARHAHAYSIYERLLGHVPTETGSPEVGRRCGAEEAELAKSEPKAFQPFRRDGEVRETNLWGEFLAKALPAPDPAGPKVPKPPVAGAPVAADRKQKFGGKTSATAPTAAPAPKPPATPKTPTAPTTKVPAAPKPPKVGNQSPVPR